MIGKLVVIIDQAVKEELERTYTEYGFPKFNSAHEGYAVIKEEVEETEQELTGIKIELENIWSYIKRNAPDKTTKGAVVNIHKHATLLACEAIQVAAMAQKYIDSLMKEV